MPNKSTPAISEKELAEVPTMSMKTLCATIRRVCRYAQMDAEQDGRHPPGWSVHAFPYAEALATLDDVRDMYYADSAVYLIAYLENNLHNWRGDAARACKKRLNEIYKEGAEFQRRGMVCTAYNARWAQP
jgi:hypothetical protein